MEISSNQLSTSVVLQQLGKTQEASIEVNQRMQTGKKVNNASEDISTYLQSRAYNDRVSEIEYAQDRATNGIQAANVALSTVDTIEANLSQMLSYVEEYHDSDDDGYKTILQEKYTQLIDEIETLAIDSEYAGQNLLYDDSTDTDPADVNINLLDGQDATLPSFNLYIQSDSVTGNPNALVFNYNGNTQKIAIPGELDGQSEWDIDNIEGVFEEVETATEFIESYGELLATSTTELESTFDFHTQLIASYEEADSDISLTDLSQDAAIALSIQTAEQLATQVLQLTQENVSTALRMLS